MQSERRQDEMISHIKARRRAQQIADGQKIQGPFLLLASVAWVIFLILLSNRSVL